MTKRILSFALCVMMICSMLTVVAYAENALITFDPMAKDGGSLTVSPNWRYAEVGKPMGEMPIPVNSKPNMSFEGWWDDDFLEEITPETIVTGSMVLHALWMEKQPLVEDLPFEDVSKSDWFYEGISYCYENGLMNGMGDKLFAPDAPCTRAMVVTVIYRMDGEGPVGGLKNPFTDLTADWYRGAVMWAADQGIVKGMDPTTFAPDLNITREQLAAIMYRYAAYCHYDVSDGIMLVGYEDNDLISDYAKTPMSWAAGIGLIQGMKDEDGRLYLDPQGYATRAQIATILMRFCKTYAPREEYVKWNGLIVNIPQSWVNYYSYLNEEKALTFYCRPEREISGAGFLCCLELILPENCKEIPVKHEILGTLEIECVTYNVVLILPSGVETEALVDLYLAMYADIDALAHGIHGDEGTYYSHG